MREPVSSTFKVRLWSGALFFVTCCLLVGMPRDHVLAATNESSAGCQGSSYHRFDFWIGDWAVSDVGSPVTVARARIDSILDGCVLREDYRGYDGHGGQSFTIYDASQRVWHQTWMTNGGSRLEIEGKFENGEMTLSGRNQQGEMVRGIWKPVKGEVRETALKSPDHGKTWLPWFDIIFRAATDTKGGSVTDDQEHDKQTVAALDSEYQDAVKRNDAAIMDRILADDFILITSSGRTYRKSELLDEAKSGRTIYEHQEDTDKTVRLWGDTAIVTAKLWEKGKDSGKPFEYRLWFSDVYRRTPDGWKYVFAQSAYRPEDKLQ